MYRTVLWLCCAMFVATPRPSAAECRLCAPVAAEDARAVRPLGVEVDAGLDFSRAAQSRGGGSIALDPVSGRRSVTGLVDLGGMAMRGVVRITGEPHTRVRIDLPKSVSLMSASGSPAEVVDLHTDLSPDPVLDGDGRLSFAFGGRLIIQGSATGSFRGRIAIDASYQ